MDLTLAYDEKVVDYVTKLIMDHCQNSGLLTAGAKHLQHKGCWLKIELCTLGDRSDALQKKLVKSISTLEELHKEVASPAKKSNGMLTKEKQLAFNEAESKLI